MIKTSNKSNKKRKLKEIVKRDSIKYNPEIDNSIPDPEAEQEIKKQIQELEEEEKTEEETNKEFLEIIEEKDNSEIYTDDEISYIKEEAEQITDPTEEIIEEFREEVADYSAEEKIFEESEYERLMTKHFDSLRGIPNTQFKHLDSIRIQMKRILLQEYNETY